MSGNRTTELLCKLLEERGIEWSHGDAAYEIEWSTPDGRHCSAMYWNPTFTVLVSGCTPEQAIVATLGSDQEANLGDALNEVAEKWAEAQVSAEEYAKRCRMLESLARDMFAYIDNCCESDLSFGCVDPVDCAYYDKARDWCTKASSLKQRMKALGLVVD